MKPRPEAKRGKRLHARRFRSAARRTRTSGPRPTGPLETLESVPRPLVLALSIVLVLGIALVNHLSSLDLRFSFFYLLPIALVSWLVGRDEGLILSLGSTAIWLVQHLRDSGIDPTKRTTAFLNAVLLLGFFGLFSFLLSALRLALAREKEAARVDSLTGVPNRRAFFELAESEIQRAWRYRGRFTVAFLDLDHFKSVNDRKGHAAGDRVLQRLATAVRGALRANDVVARLGGDEFVVLLPETGAAEADPVLDKLRHRIGEARSEEDPLVTVSTGCVTFEAPPGSVDEMLKVVDELMYTAKIAGGNTIVRRVVADSGRVGHTDDSAAADRNQS